MSILRSLGAHSVCVPTAVFTWVVRVWKRGLCTSHRILLARSLAAFDSIRSRTEYPRVVVPALAFFAIPASAGDMFPWVVTEDSTVRKNMARLYELNLANIRRQEAMFDTEVAASTAVELLGAKHNIFVSNESDVLKGISGFSDAHPE